MKATRDGSIASLKQTNFSNDELNLIASSFPENDSRDISGNYKARQGGNESDEQDTEDEQDAVDEKDTEDKDAIEDEEGNEDEGDTEGEQPVPVSLTWSASLDDASVNGKWGLSNEDTYLAKVAERKPRKNQKKRAAKTFAQSKTAAFKSIAADNSNKPASSKPPSASKHKNHMRRVGRNAGKARMITTQPNAKGDSNNPTGSRRVTRSATGISSSLPSYRISALTSVGSSLKNAVQNAGMHSASTVSPSITGKLKRSRLDDDAADAEDERSTKRKRATTYRVPHWRRMLDEATSVTDAQLETDTTGEVQSPVSGYHELPRHNVKELESTPRLAAPTNDQSQKQLSWGLDDKTKKMLMDAGIGIANPLCRCPCHGGNPYDHTAQKCHCMSKEALAKKYWEENPLF